MLSDPVSLGIIYFFWLVYMFSIDLYYSPEPLCKHYSGSDAVLSDQSRLERWNASGPALNVNQQVLDRHRSNQIIFISFLCIARNQNQPQSMAWGHSQFESQCLGINYGLADLSAWGGLTRRGFILLALTWHAHQYAACYPQGNELHTWQNPALICWSDVSLDM